MPKFLHEFNHYTNGTVTDNGWWQIDGNRLLNPVGGWHDYFPESDDIIVEANTFEDLDWSCLIDNKQITGWLDLDGNFYGCKPFNHSQLAQLYFKSTERELEKIGFIKVFHNYNRDIKWYCEKREPTKKTRGLLD